MPEPADPSTRERVDNLSLIDCPIDATTDQLCDWLDYRIRRGDELRCEELLATFPLLLEDPEAALDLIYTEYNARCETASPPDHEEFFSRFPQWRKNLEHQFQLVKLFDSSATPIGDVEAASSSRVSGSPSRYRVGKLLARGGIGQVMQAIDTELNREVAVKEIQAHLIADIGVRERFLREAEITGQLEHPGIVPVYGLGSDENDQPFYAMRLVRGQSLLDAIHDFHHAHDSNGFRSFHFQNLLRRFLSVCETISYAHSRGVIHRDIKPENILLGPFGETLVVDWGLAKVARAPATLPAACHEDTESVHPLDSTSEHSAANWSVELTQSAGALVGTPAYMSPEQARGESASITSVSDVYSLGATLHRLLTGVSRFPTNDLGMTLRAILNDELPSPRKVNRHVPKCLDAICAKALQFKPEDRYAAVADMARDIEHYLADEPTTALRESAIAQLSRLTRRHRSLAFSAVVSMMILTLVTVVAAVRIDRERQQTERAVIAAERGNARLAFDRGYQLLESHQFGEGLLWLQRALTYVPTADQPMRRVILTNMESARSHLLVRHAIFENQSGLAVFQFDIEGRFLMTIDRTGHVRYWNADDGSVVAEHQLPISRVFAAKIDPQGVARVATATGRNLALYTVTGSQSPAKVWAAEQPGEVQSVTISPDGNRAAVRVKVDARSSIRVLDTAGAQLIGTLPATTSSQFIFDDVHSRLICINDRDKAKFWKWQADEQEYKIVASHDDVRRLTFSADGKWVLVGTTKGGVRCLAAQSLKLHHDFGQFSGEVVAMAVSPDSQVLVAVWDNGVSRSWNLQDLRPACESLRVDRYTDQIMFRPRTRQLALLAKPHTVALWQLPMSDTTSIPLPMPVADSIEYSRDGTLAIASFRGSAQLMDGATGKAIGGPMRHSDTIKTACLHPNGRLALTAGFDGIASLWNTDTGRQASVQLSESNTDRTTRLHAGAFSPDGRCLATSANGGSIKIWDVTTGALLRTMQSKYSAIKVCFSPSSRYLLAGYNIPDCGVRMWDVETGRLLWTGKHTAAIRSIAISPDGKIAVSGSNDETAQLWDATSGEALGPPLPGRGEIFATRFHPNGSMLATGGYDATIRLWRVPTGELIGEPMMHQALVTDFVFSRDGMRLLSGSFDATARLWDVDSCLPLSPPMPHDSAIMSVALNPTADVALTGRRWHLPSPLPDEPELIALWTRLATQRTLSAGNNVQWLSPKELVEDDAKFEAKAGCSWREWSRDL